MGSGASTAPPLPSEVPYSRWSAAAWSSKALAGKLEKAGLCETSVAVRDYGIDGRAFLVLDEIFLVFESDECGPSEVDTEEASEIVTLVRAMRANINNNNGEEVVLDRATVLNWSPEELAQDLTKRGLTDAASEVLHNEIDGVTFIFGSELLLDFEIAEDRRIAVEADECRKVREMVRTMRRKASSESGGSGGVPRRASSNLSSQMSTEEDDEGHSAFFADTLMNANDAHRGKNGAGEVCKLVQKVPEEADDHTDYSKLPYRPGERIPPSDIVVKRYLGSGAFGHVYIAEHRFTGDDQKASANLLAMKVCKVSSSDADPESVAKVKALQLDLCDEAATALHVGVHPNVIALRYVTVDETLFCGFSDLVNGRELAEMIGDADRRQRGELYTGSEGDALRRILGIWIQLARGLAHMHRRGVLHQDIKPANIMVTFPDDVVKIADYGLSRVGAGSGGVLRAVYHGCTPRYRSPEIAALVDLLKPHEGFTKDERVAQRDAHPLSVQGSDMWAFGLVGLQMYAGGRNWNAGGEGAAKSLDGYLSLRRGARKWDNAQVCDYLREQTLSKLKPEYVEAFASKGVTGEMLLNLQKEELQDPSWGLRTVGARAKVMKPVDRGLMRYEIPGQAAALLGRIFDAEEGARPTGMDAIERELMAIDAATISAAADRDPLPVSDNDIAVTLGQLGRAFKRNGAMVQAVAMIRRAIEAHPEGEIAAKNYHNLGIFLDEAGRPGEAITALQKCESMMDALGMEGRGDVVLYLGNAFLADGQCGLAIASFERALTLNTEAGAVLERLAHALVAAGRHEEASAVNQRAEAAAGGEPDADALFNSGVRLYNDDSFAKAEGEFRKAELAFLAEGDEDGAEDARSKADMCKEEAAATCG